MITCSKDKTIKAFDVQNGEKLQTYKGHSKAVTDIVLSKDGNYL